MFLARLDSQATKLILQVHISSETLSYARVLKSSFIKAVCKGGKTFMIFLNDSKVVMESKF